MGKKNILVLIIVVIAACFSTTMFFFFSINKVNDIYISQTRENIMQLKKSFLKNTVNNLIKEIDAEREMQKEFYKGLVQRQDQIIMEKMILPENEFEDFIVEYFNSNSDTSYWNLLIWNDNQKKEIHDPKNLIDGKWDGTNHLNVELTAYKQITFNDRIILYGISKSYIDETVKDKIADKIRISEFDEESYIWVNEVKNYTGGEKYAIRRVHPNLPETEGSYLSTAMKDIKGNLPYMEELEGVKEAGEVYFTYYFKKLNSDIVSEKLTYAKLYKDFDWIIAMGVHMDDVQTYIELNQAEQKRLTGKIIIQLVMLFSLLLFFGFAIVILINKLQYENTKRVMVSQINQDSLTKACSRRGGTADLISFFKDYKAKGESPAIMIFDIDHFKSINDTFGHDVGDQVLKEVVNSVYKIIRSSDKLIRWGGDEFVGAFHRLRKENCIHFGEKILFAVSNLDINDGKEQVEVTLSIGFSYFMEEDTDYMDAIRRADKALYEAKSAGRNCVRVVYE